MNESSSSESPSQQMPDTICSDDADDVFDPQEGIEMLLEEANQLINDIYTPHEDIKNFLTLNFDLLNIVFENDDLKDQFLNAIYALHISMPEKPATDLENHTEMMEVNSEYCEIVQECINKKSHKVLFIDSLEKMLPNFYSDMDHNKKYSFAVTELIDVSLAIKTMIELNYSKDSSERFLNDRVNTLLNQIQGIHEILDNILPKYYDKLNENKLSNGEELSTTLKSTLSITAQALGFYVVHIQFYLNSGILSHLDLIQAKVKFLEESLKAISDSKMTLDEEAVTLQRTAMFQLQLAYGYLQEAEQQLPPACHEVQEILNTYNRLSNLDSMGQVTSFQALVKILKALSTANIQSQDVFIQDFEKICGYLISMQSRPSIPDVERNALLILSRLVIEVGYNTKKFSDSVPYAKSIWNGNYARMLELLNYNVYLTLEKTSYTPNQMDQLITRFKKNKKFELAKIEKYSKTMQNHLVRSTETLQPIEEILENLELVGTKKKKKKKKKKKNNVATLDSNDAVPDNIKQVILGGDSGSQRVQAITSINSQSDQEKEKEVLPVASESAQGNIHTTRREIQSPNIVLNKFAWKEQTGKSESVNIKHEQHEVQRKTDTEFNQDRPEIIEDNTDTTCYKAKNIKIIEKTDEKIVSEPKLKEKETNSTTESEFHFLNADKKTNTKRKNNRSKSQRNKIKKQQQATEVAKQQSYQIEIEQKADAEHGKDLLKEICHGTHATICKPSESIIIENASKIAAIPFHELIHLLGDIFFSGQGVLVLEEFRRLKLFKHIFNLHNDENEVDTWYSNQGLYYHHIKHMIHQQFDRNCRYENFEDNQLDLMAILLLPALYSYVNQCDDQLDLGCKVMLDALFADKNTFNEDSKIRNNEYHKKLQIKLKNVYDRHQSFCIGAQFEHTRRIQDLSSQPIFFSGTPTQNPDYPQVVGSHQTVLTPLYSSMLQHPTASSDNQERLLSQSKHASGFLRK